MTDLASVIAVVSSVLAVVTSVTVAVITQRGNLKIARQESQASPYSELADRVTELEQADRAKAAWIAELEDLVAELRRDRDEDRAYIRRLLAAWSMYLPDVIPPQPVPAWYLPHPSQQPKEQ